MPGQGRSINPQFFEDGGLHEVPGYTTDLLTDRAIAFIERERERPFLVYLAHKAVHPDVVQRDDGSVDPESDQGYIPAPRHEGRYRDRTYPPRWRQAELGADLEGKPAVRQALARLPGWSESGHDGHAGASWAGEATIRRRAEMILAVDEGLGRIMARLDSLGLLDRTAIVLTSDNGFFFGEHGLTTERRLPYEESIRNPLLVRYPPRVRAGSRPDGLALTVDLAPTLLELAGAPVGAHIQGRSLVPLFAGTPADFGAGGVLHLRESLSSPARHGLPGSPHQPVQVHPLDPAPRPGRAVRSGERYPRAPEPGGRSRVPDREDGAEGRAGSPGPARHWTGGALRLGRPVAP
jgi:N-acetylglucosamine-6-sulfatase